MDLVTLYLNLMSSNNQSQVIILEKFFRRCQPILYRALPLWVFHKIILICDIIFNGVRPYYIAQKSLQWQLLKPVHAIDFIECLHIWRYTAMHAQVFLINNSH